MKCELFPQDGDSLANVELPQFENVQFTMSSRNVVDDTHVIRLYDKNGKTYAVHVKYEGTTKE